MDRNLTLEAVRLTEAAALYASRSMGQGDPELAYESSTEAMANVFSTMNIDGLVVISADSVNNILHDNERIGNKNGLKVDLAVKPLDGKKTCARGGDNAISIVVIGSEGSFLKVPAGYMRKIAVGKEAKGEIDINESVEVNIKRVARAKGKYIDDITVCVLDRPINSGLVENIRETGAKIKYITDGDISGIISTALDKSSIDILMGIGGAKETVVSAAALRCLDGDMQASFVDIGGIKEKVVKQLGRGAFDKIYSVSDLVQKDNFLVSATGVTNGLILPGVRYFVGGAETHSIVFRQKTHTLRFIRATHRFDYKPVF